MKFKTKAKECQLLVRVKASFGETIDEKDLDRFSRTYLRGFLRPRLVKKNVIEYTGPVGISLYERLKKPVSKREFLFIIEQIVVAIQKLYVNNMAINNMIMNIQQVYINEVTKEVQFVYIPMTKGQQEPNFVEFIESIAYSIKPSDEKDNDYVSRFIYFFRAMQPLDLNKIEAFVAKEDRSVVNTIKKQNAGQSGFMTDKPQDYYAHYNDKRGEEYDPPTDRLNEMGAVSPIDSMGGVDDPTGLLNEVDDPTGLLNEDNDDDLADATGLLGDGGSDAAGMMDSVCEPTGLLNENNAAVKFPTLYRVLTEETISVNKAVFRLGKERSYVDYFVTNNIAVSRSHADIITRGNKYFVKDLNSKNRTYINEQEIPVHIEVEIHNGDRLKLGNEEFVFNI